MTGWLGPVLALTLPTAGAHAAEPIAVWRLDEPAGTRVLDASGNGCDGRVCGATRIDGLFGKALRFDGKDDYVRCPGVGSCPEGTVEAWVKLLAPARGQTGFVTFGMGYGRKNDVAILGNAPSTPSAPLSSAAFGVCTSAWHAARRPSGLPIGQWRHLAATWGRNGLALYVDGRLAASNKAYTGPLPGHSAVLLGAGAWNAHLACEIDDVRVYGTALAPEVLARHFQQRAYIASTPQPERSFRRLHKHAVANVADFYDSTDFTCAIQKAVDSLPAGGGVVTIPPGTYVLRRAIRLRRRVTLQGAGPATVLTRVPQVRSRLTASAKAGDRTVTVADATGFEVGAQVGVKSRRMGGWYATHALVEAVDGEVIRLDRPLVKPYDVADQAVVINYFPAVEAIGLTGVVVQDLAIDGVIDESPGPESDFTFAAIHFHNTSEAAIRRCVVRDWPSDGIGVQAGRNVHVEGCRVSGCRGHGYHPGTSLRHAVFNANIGHHNTGDGLYFCAAVRSIVVSNSVFHHNGRHGIGGLGGGRDRFNIVTANVCESNGCCGVDASGGADNTIADNICLNNSQARPGAWPGILLRDSTHCTVTGNRCADDQKTPTQRKAIVEAGASRNNMFSANHPTYAGDSRPVAPDAPDKGARR